MKYVHVSAAVPEDVPALFSKRRGVLPGQQAQKYNRLLGTGFLKNGFDIVMLSQVPLGFKDAPFRLVAPENKHDKGLDYRFIGFLNVPVLKNICAYACSRRFVKKVIKQYGAPRRTSLVYRDELAEEPEEETVPDYPVTVFLSRHGYLKKITAQSLRMSGEQKYKEDDGLRLSFEATNKAELLVFTDRCQVYKTRLSEFEDGRASALGTFLPTKLQMDDGESVIMAFDPGDYGGSILFAFEKGKIARVGQSAYVTKTNRKKLTGAYSDRSPIRAILPFRGETMAAVYSTEGRALILNTAQLAEKSTRDSQGVQVLTLKPKYKLKSAEFLEESRIVNRSRYTARSLPAAGALLKPEDTGETQIAMEGE